MSEKLVRVELLADGMRVGGLNKEKGDVIEIPESHARVLESLGSVRFSHKAVKTEAEATSVEEHDDEPAPAAAPRPRPATRRRGSA